MAKMADTIIREAKISDCDNILDLMQELSKEMKIPSSGKLSAKDLERDVFGERPVFSLYVCHPQESSITGYALFYYTYSGWEGRSVCVEELFVVPSQRRKGEGSSLLKKVVQIALEMGCKRCHFNALLNNEFLLSQGAVDIAETDKLLFFRMNRENMEVFVKSCKMLEGVKIRRAEKTDCIGIRKLMQDLADYEKVPDAVKLDPLTLQKDGYEGRPFYGCFVAEVDGELVGYSLYFHTYNREGPGVHMEDLYVSPQYRKKGIGVVLWGNIIKTGLDMGGIRCDFAVFDYNTPSIDFYKSKGAMDMTHAHRLRTYKMTTNVMKNYGKVC